MNATKINSLQFLLFFLLFFAFSCSTSNRYASDHTSNQGFNTKLKKYSTHRKQSTYSHKVSGKKRSSLPKTSTKEKLKHNNYQLTEKVVHIADQYKGTPYLYGGKSPGGFDCSGFTCYVYSKAGVQLSGNSNQLAKMGKKVSLSEIQQGDLLFFGGKGKISHVAIISDVSDAGIELIHSTSSRGVVREKITGSSYWESRILFAKRII